MYLCVRFCVMYSSLSTAIIPFRWKQLVILTLDMSVIKALSSQEKNEHNIQDINVGSFQNEIKIYLKMLFSGLR